MTSNEVFIYLPWKTTFSVNRSALREPNLIIQPWPLVSLILDTWCEIQKYRSALLFSTRPGSDLVWISTRKNFGEGTILVQHFPRNLERYTCVMWGREPRDAMSLRYADTILPNLLGRPNFRYAVMSMRNTSKCACVIKEGFLNLCFKF